MICPLCGEQFRAELEDPDSDRASQRSRYRRRREYDDDYSSRRRPRRYREEDKCRILEAARVAIAWPANGLMWTGAVGTVLCVLAGVGLAVAGFIYSKDPSSPLFFVYAVMIGGMGSVYHLLLAISGFQMKKLRGTGWGYAGGGLGIASFALVGICSPSTWAAVTFGIWALVALGKPEVQDAIRINTRPREE